MNTEEKLNRLSELQVLADDIRNDYAELKKAALTPEIAAKLTILDDEMNNQLAQTQVAIDSVTTEIKLDTINSKGTIHGKFLMAVYNKARVTWDNKGLEGFMVAHPEIVAFRKEGEPTVTIRKSGKGE
jgi:hypothetical protein